MSSKLFRLLHRNTALDLTLKFTVLFFISALVIFITADMLLTQAQKEKDQQLIMSLLENYRRLELSAGFHKLELVITRDTPYLRKTDMWLEITDADAQPILLIQPEAWPITGSPIPLNSTKGEWFETLLPNSDLELIIGQTVLSDGSYLRIGRSIAQREMALAEYRAVILQVMFPLFMLGLLLTYYMNWKALRQVNDLIATVRSITAADMQARVQVRNPRTELGQLAQLFNAMLSQIEQLILSMQHSLDAVAHDLRTPLSRMRLSIESALEDRGKDSLREALLDCAEENGKIEAMLKALMDISEAESGTLKLHKERLHLNDLVSECLEVYRYAAEDKGIELKADIGTPIDLVADKIRLYQVFSNLIDNAIKYSKPGGKVTIRLEENTDSIKVDIMDQGIGISPENHKKVFRRLFRADQSRSEPGMGLGLSLVKAIVEAHGGGIDLDAALDKGCKVSIVFQKS